MKILQRTHARRRDPDGRTSRDAAPPSDRFRVFAHRASYAVGTPWAFMLAVLVIVAWALTGPIFHYSDTWQLVINTGTTIVTFLMVFLIQNTQNRDATAAHLKLDELIRATQDARTELVDLEDLSDAELEELHREFHALHEQYHAKVNHLAAEKERRRHGRGRRRDD